MLNRQAILSDQFSIPFLDEVKNYLSKQVDLNPLIRIYLEIYFSILNMEEEKHFKKLRKLIKENSRLIVKEEMRAIYLSAINIAVRKLRQGKDGYLSITLDLYLEGIETKLIYDNNYLSHWTYDNVLKLILRLQKFELFEQFIHQYNKDLKPPFRKDALQYNLAEFYFLKNDNGKTLYHLNKVQFKDIKYILGSRLLLIKTFYRSNAYDALLSALASFTIYLKRNKQVAQSFKAGFINYCSLLNQILRENHKKKAILKQQVLETQPLVERAWLLQVFEDIY